MHGNVGILQFYDGLRTLDEGMVHQLGHRTHGLHCDASLLEQSKVVYLRAATDEGTDDGVEFIAVEHQVDRASDQVESSTKWVKELKLDGATSKAWTTQDGKVREGKPIDQGLIYKLLGNRTYLGELRHKELWCQADVVGRTAAAG